MKREGVMDSGCEGCEWRVEYSSIIVWCRLMESFVVGVGNTELCRYRVRGQHVGFLDKEFRELLEVL